MVFLIKKKIERNCRVDSWSILLLMVYPDGLVFGWTRKTYRSSINYHCFTDNRAEIAQWEHLLHGWTFVFANLLRKFRFSLLIFFAHYWNRGSNFLQSYSVADLKIRILLVLFMHFSREMNWVCFLCVFFSNTFLSACMEVITWCQNAM